MANSTNIARPYAKAAFEYALAHQALPAWGTWLSALQAVLSSSEMLAFIDNPETTVTQHIEAVGDVLLSITKEKALPEELSRFIHILAENRRLPVMPAICTQFEKLRANEENRISVQVTSFAPLSKAQEEQLIERLTKRLNREVTLDISIDPGLLGGAVISADDWVINSSVKYQLSNLGADLVAL